jgi:CheY-like chemotaxis protein
VFTLELPAHVGADSIDSPQAPPAEDPPAPATIPGDAATVLVVDDDSTVRDLMTRLLEKMGYRAVLAADGADALRLAREIRPSVITLDVVMPQVSGWDVLQRLKADPELASIPVIMVTIEDQEALGLSRGASNYIVKPVDRDRLAEALDKCRIRSAHQEPDMALTSEGGR